ncbi:MAG: asd [Bacillales bacterium]|jgi:aspartate-semialdehyde dehydrogenase|nr:asd [Bacillales bacterium]
MERKYNFAIVGATGAVGERMISTLETAGIPIGEIKLLSSKRSEGKKILFQGKTVTVEEATENSFEGIDIALFSAGGDVSKWLIPHAVKAGAICVDNTSAYRMDSNVPLVVPEVNEDALFKHNGIIANPNCSTIQMVAALEPIRKTYGLKKVVVSTYQAVSGAGVAAIDELDRQTKSILAGESVKPGVLPVKKGLKHHQIAFNCIPQIDVFHENGYTLEELKMINETKKIMEMPDLHVAATCVRLPIATGHSESVYIEVEKLGATVSEIHQLLKDAPGVVLVDEPENHAYPMPVDAVGCNDVFVGRVRKDLDNPRGFHLWVVSDNLLKGAAWNSVQIAQSLVKKGIVK